MRVFDKQISRSLNQLAAVPQNGREPAGAEPAQIATWLAGAYVVLRLAMFDA